MLRTGTVRIAIVFVVILTLLAFPPYVRTVSGESVQASCNDGGAIEDPLNNPALVSDCETLLAVRDVLAGNATLNWSENLPIAEWDRVTVNGRVTGLDLFRWSHRDPSGEALTGEIPPQLGNLTGLSELLLGVNRLTGPVPIELGNLQALEILWIDVNILTGEIPTSIANLTALTDLRLGSNSFRGRIPPELASLTRLQVLNLRDNFLTGPIPTELAGLTKLERLDLAGNLLTGPIIPELGELSGLWMLDLSYNRLTGEIPPTLADLTNLTRLSVLGNPLTGCIQASLRKIDFDYRDLLPVCFEPGFLPERYDTNHSGSIDGDEILRAVRDYFRDEIDGPQVLELVALSFSPPPLIPSDSSFRLAMVILFEVYREIYDQLLEQPWYSDGVSDQEWAYIVAYHNEPQSLFEPYIAETRSISLPLAGDVRIWVFSRTAVTHDLFAKLEVALRGMEELMNELSRQAT